MALSELRKSQIVALFFIFLGIGLSVGLTLSNADTFKILAVFGVLIVAPLFVIQPQYGFLALLIARPIIDLLGQEVNFNIRDVITLNLNAIVGILFVGWGILYLAYKRVKIYHVPVFYPLLALSFLSLISVFVTDFKIIAFGEWIRVTSFVVIVLLGYHFADNLHRFRVLCHAILLSSIVPVFLGLFQLITGGGISDEASSNRIFATFAHPSLFGQYLAALMVLILVLSLLYRRYGRIYGAAYLVYGFLLIFTFSRGAWMFAAMGSFLLGIIFYRAHLHKVFMFGLLFLFMIAGASFFLQSYTSFQPVGTSILERVSQTTQASPDSSIVWRFQFWEKGIAAGKPFLVRGYGAGTFLEFAEREINSSFEAHNDFLKISIEIGIFGLAAFIGFFIALFSSSIRSYSQNKTRERYIFAMLIVSEGIGMLFVSFFDNLYQNTTFYWVVLAVIGASFRLLQQERNS